MAEKCSWPTAKVTALISIWGERAIQSQLDGSVRNKEIYTEIAHKLSDLGYSRDWKQCRCKIKNLKTTYKKSKITMVLQAMEEKLSSFFNNWMKKTVVEKDISHITIKSHCCIFTNRAGYMRSDGSQGLRGAYTCTN